MEDFLAAGELGISAAVAALGKNMCAEVLIGEYGNSGIVNFGEKFSSQSSVGDDVASNKDGDADGDASNKDGDGGGGSLTASTTTLFLVDFPLPSLDFLLVLKSKGNSSLDSVNGAYIGASSSDAS